MFIFEKINMNEINKMIGTPIYFGAPKKNITTKKQKLSDNEKQLAKTICELDNEIYNYFLK